MKAAHYPGPWSLRKRRDGSYNVYSASHDVALCVAPCNASLVRAAPDLFAALESAATALEDIRAGYPDRELHKPAAQVIAEARAALAMAADGLP